MADYKLDKVDEILLYELGIDARTPLNAIARKHSLSKDTMTNRLRRLESDGIVRKYITRLNLTSLGYTMLTFLAKSDGLNPKLSEFVASSLGSIKQIGWLGILSGPWDIYGGFYVKDFEEALEVKERIMEQVGEHLLTVAYCMNLNRTFYNNMGFLRQPEKWKKIKSIDRYDPKKTPVKLDEDDIAILQVIENNARASYVEIGERTGIHPSKVQFRLKQLIKKKVILNFRTLFDEKRIGMAFSAVTLRFKRYDKSVQSKLEEICDTDPYVGYLGRIVGPFDAWVEFHIPEGRTLGIGNRIKTYLADELLAIDHINYQEIKKVRYYPKDIIPLEGG
jgi:DNA-binding Lrp family transcriptional regulator